MIDVDRALHGHGAQWRAGEPAFADLHVSIEAATTAADERRHWSRWSMAGAAAVVVALAVAIWPPTGDHNSDTAATPSAAAIRPPSSITSHGSAVPYAGRVPWSDAVLDPAHAEIVYVEADQDALVSKKTICGVSEERVSVQERADSVVVLVAGYAHPLPKGVSCAAVGHAPQRQRVVLAAPLAGRRLVDAASGRTHRVLDPAHAATVTRPPAGCETTPVMWDETSGVITTSCSNGSRGGSRLTVDTSSGTPAALVADNITPEGRPSGRSEIGTVAADLWHYTDTDNDVWTIRWRPSTTRQLVVRILTGRLHGLDRSHALSVARSVR